MQRKSVSICDHKMSYLEEGEGDPILLIHGMPSSSYAWRNIIPHLARMGRCIAPDLIGSGQSDRPAEVTYSVFDYVNHIKMFIEKLQLQNITLIMHGWGTVIGLSYAMNYKNNCKALAFYEALLHTGNNNYSLPCEEQISFFKNRAMQYGDGKVSQLIREIIGQLSIQQLDENVLRCYTNNYNDNAALKPLIRYFNELPTNNCENEIEGLIQDYTVGLTNSSLPKLMLYSLPGFMTPIATIIWAKKHIPFLEVVEVGEELHLGQESHPILISNAISAWLQGMEQVVV